MCRSASSASSWPRGTCPPDKPGPDRPRPHLDLLGLALLAPGIAAVILGLSNAGSAAGFAHPDVLAPLGLGVALIAAFTGYALRRPGALVDVRLLARRPVASASAVLFFSGFSLYGAMLLLPLYYQEVRGVSALTAGLMLVPQGVGALLSRGLAGRLTDTIGARPIAVAGFAIVAAATVPFAFAGPGTSPWLLALWLVIRGFGLGAVTIPVMAVAFLGLDKQQIAHSSVVTRTVQQIGGSFGTAVLAVILSGAIAARHGDPPPRSTSRSGGPPGSPPSPCCSRCGCPPVRGGGGGPGRARRLGCLHGWTAGRLLRHLNLGPPQRHLRGSAHDPGQHAGR